MTNTISRKFHAANYGLSGGYTRRHYRGALVYYTINPSEPQHTIEHSLGERTLSVVESKGVR